MKKPWNKYVYYGLLAVFAVTFLISGIYIVRYMIDSGRSNELDEDLQNLVTTAPSDPDNSIDDPTDAPTDPPPTNPDDPTEVTAPTILPEYAPIYQLNSDTIGWIRVEGTVINYPVMQTPGDTDFYLYRDFNKNYSAWGTIYIRETSDPFAPSDNITIYGHHMQDGSRFSDLDRYMFYEKWEQQPFVQFDTLYERHTYKIFAVFNTTGNTNGFAYHAFDNASSAAEFDAFIATAKGLAMYDTGITPKYGDKIISLSTCTTDLDNGRLVVMAVRVS